MSIMFAAGVDWSVPTFVLLAGVVLRGVAGGVASRGVASAAAASPSAAAASAGSGASGYASQGFGRRAAPALLSVAFAHAFAGPILGMQNLGGSIMYSNLRVAGGSNHVLLPTNLLRLTGAVVRVEACSSAAVNALYPGDSSSPPSPPRQERERESSELETRQLRTGDFSSVFSPRAVALLRASGHSGRQFNFAMGRVLGAWALPPPPARFVRYTVPSLELRRLLAEARGAGEAFALEYSVLAGPEGDEAWRSSSVGVRRVRVSEDPAHGVAECVVVSAEGRPSGAACEDGELARLPPLRAWERVWGVWNPHPILPSLSEEMHCSE